MKIVDVLWIEDDSAFVNGTLANFKEDRDELGFAIVPWHYVSKKDFEENSHMELDALHMGLVCVDYHLPGGINGNEIIVKIRSYAANSNIDIVFYSAIKNEIELKEMLEAELADLANIYFAHKDTLEDRIHNLLA